MPHCGNYGFTIAFYFEWVDQAHVRTDFLCRMGTKLMPDGLYTSTPWPKYIDKCTRSRNRHLVHPFALANDFGFGFNLGLQTQFWFADLTPLGGVGLSSGKMHWIVHIVCPATDLFTWRFTPP